MKPRSWRTTCFDWFAPPDGVEPADEVERRKASIARTLGPRRWTGGRR